ncbi:putative Ig domain-containing protein [Nocardioides sp. L-11A]|uniref:putative Ig domain-containing protein n=1 Tax=Nocardioides sp. L-11A TaxID=3043848 RepID=UPI00249C8D8A|nr:putative Ig domain-containing protein [Nocardioides sp. L-11A]
MDLLLPRRRRSWLARIGISSVPATVLMTALLTVLATLAVVGVTSPATAAAPGNMRAPFANGESWFVYQGYRSGTHASGYALDLTRSTSKTSTSGAGVIAPLSGTVSYWQVSHGNLCVNISGGRSYTLTHINASKTSGTITAGQKVGTVAAAGAVNNNGVAHLHFGIWSKPNCPWSQPQYELPFDSVNKTRICGAPDMKASGPSGTGGWSNGTWSGTTIKADTCGAAAVKPRFTAAAPPTRLTYGVAYSYAFKASGTPAPTFSKASGTLPGGLTLSSKGVLSGTPNKPGSYAFVVRASNSAGSVDTAKLTLQVPVPVVSSTSLPVITGSPQVGQKLSNDGGRWSPADATRTFQWLADGKPITGATAASYTPVAADVGRRLAVRVTAAKKDHTSATATSAPTGAVLAAPACLTAQSASAGAATALATAEARVAKLKKALKKARAAHRAAQARQLAKRLKKAKAAARAAAAAAASAQSDVAASCR